MLLHLRDEAHRFAVSYHRRRARKELVVSALSGMPGIGPARRKALLKHFRGMEEMKGASLEELMAAGGLPEKVARELKERLIS